MWYWFVEWGWLYVMLVMSIILIVQLIIHWKSWSNLRKFGAFVVIVLTLHVWEEWVIPGGFHYIYNINSEALLRNRYPMNELTDMLTNFMGGLLWFILTETNTYGRKMHVCVTLFSYFEVFVHFLLAYQSMTYFYNIGIYTGFYAPGLITALLCWLPLGISGTVWLIKNKMTIKDLIGGIIILALCTIFMVNMPEKIFKSQHNPYIFDNAGWYEQYTTRNGEIKSQVIVD